MSDVQTKMNRLFSEFKRKYTYNPFFRIKEMTYLYPIPMIFAISNKGSYADYVTRNFITLYPESVPELAANTVSELSSYNELGKVLGINPTAVANITAIANALPDTNDHKRILLEWATTAKIDWWM